MCNVPESAYVLFTVVSLSVFFALVLQDYKLDQESVARRELLDRIKRNVTNRKEEVVRKKQVIQVTPRISVAIGYALSNSIMIEGSDGVVIVDVTESMSAAGEVFAAFRNITDKPVKGIIYTHNHPDHVNGAKAFIEPGQTTPQIWAHRDLMKLKLRQNYMGPLFYERGARQFGVKLPKKVKKSAAGKEHKTENGMIPPNRLMEGDEMDINITGILMKLVHIPGETEDQIGVWLPGDRAFLSADIIYKAFPNLYAIRGTPSRDLVHWYTSIDCILSYRPLHLVPSHTTPVYGEEEVKDLLTVYRDAIQYIHDQTVRHMNRGYLPEEIADMVKLPDHLASHPYLQEVYGTVRWSVKGVFNSYIGWYSGDPVDLSPISPIEMANRMVLFGGGVVMVTKFAENALIRGELQWALMLSSYLLRVDSSNTRAREVKVISLMALGEAETNSNSRNYYFTYAFEMLGEANVRLQERTRRDALNSLPLIDVFHLLPMRWNPESCPVVNSSVEFWFTDIQQSIRLNVRNSVVTVSEKAIPKVCNVKVTTTTTIWRDAMTKAMSGSWKYASEAFKVDKGLDEFHTILGCFDSDY